MDHSSVPFSPIAEAGKIVLWLTYLVTAYGAAAGIIGNIQKRRRLVNSSIYSLYGVFTLMMVASALMIYAFVTHDYTIKYVAHYSDTSMPLHYKITAFWGGLDGSLLFWAVMLSIFSAIAVRANRKRHSDMIGYVVGVILIVQVFFLSLLIYSKNPFQTYLTTPPIDGKGLNPLLQNYWMVIHPPSLYTGFVAATIPFAFCIGALATGRLDGRWLQSVRSWTLICWFFLSFGLILGGRWAYEELGWGGYWAWDPVENAGLLPWFTATAFLHSVIIQDQRGTMKVWNVVLVIITFFLTIYGTFMTRSGIVQSVHAFGEDNELALLFILFLITIFVISFGLLLWRLPMLRAKSSFESFISREFAFLLNNWVLLGCAVFVLFATMFPSISESINGQRITVGPEFFNKWMTPLGLILLFLAGAAPLLAYRRTTRARLFSQFIIPLNAFIWTIAILALFVPASRERTAIFASQFKLPMALLCFGLIAFTMASIIQEYVKGVRVRMKQTKGDPISSLAGLMFRKQRKYGGYLIHLGIALMFFGFAGKTWGQMKDFTVKPQQTFQIDGYTFRYDDITQRSDDHMSAVTAKVSMFQGNDTAGDLVAVMKPERRKYRKGDGQATTEVDIHSRIQEDIYMVLTGYEESGNTVIANFRVYINPLVNWVWLGFLFFIIGTAVCLTPRKWINGGPTPRERKTGGIVEAAIVILAIGITLTAFAKLASAQETDQGNNMAGPAAAQQAQEYDSNAMAHDEDIGYAQRCRPNSDVAERLMKELVCQCGGCERESAYECKCSYAMNMRCQVLEMLDGADLSTEAGKKAAYDKVIKGFEAKYGQQVLSTPRSDASWSVPLAAAGGALLLVFGVGRVWVRRGRRDVEERTQALTQVEEDQDYADILDDELRDQD